jgi:hypothetical protein
MKPDRSNYETWLIDWLDGTLTAHQTDELMAFLDENPDIREEADSLMLARISPARDSFPGKEKLQRSSADIITSQVEYLSAAYLEGDLSAEQEADLRQNIEMNPKNRIIFDKIQRTKLAPPVVHYMNKSSLKRITLAAKIARFSVIGLSAAAVILFLIFYHMLLPRPAAENSAVVAATTPVTIYVHQPVIFSDRNKIQTPSRAEKIGVKAGTDILSPAAIQTAALQNLQDSMATMKRAEGPESIAFTSMPVTSMRSEDTDPSLIASTINYAEPVYDDERSRLSRFIARTFREKILKEKKISDEPLKTYEVAEAGIDGLNKLLGWQMALVKTNDEAGELKSVYFSSKALKFNAPVRKTTASQ